MSSGCKAFYAFMIFLFFSSLDLIRLLFVYRVPYIHSKGRLLDLVRHFRMRAIMMTTIYSFVSLSCRDLALPGGFHSK